MNLSQTVGLIPPIRSIGVRAAGPLVGVVVGVGVAHGRFIQTGRRGLDRLQPVDLVVTVGGGHARERVLLEGNVADQCCWLPFSLRLDSHNFNWNWL